MLVLVIFFASNIVTFFRTEKRFCVYAIFVDYYIYFMLGKIVGDNFIYFRM